MAKTKNKKPKTVPKGPLLTDFEALALESLDQIAVGIKELCLVLEEKLATHESPTTGSKVSAEEAQETGAKVPDEQPDGESSIP